jgi:hypothetical protein
MDEPTSDSTIKLDLSREEIGLYANIVNEILNGIDVPDLEAQIGTSRGTANLLLRRLNSAFEATQDTPRYTMTLDADEANALRVGFLICIRELGDQEMHARTGFFILEAKGHVRTLDRLLHHPPRHDIV